MSERVIGTPRELKFGGERKAEDIKRGFAITTLRNPRDSYNFTQGEEILADCFESGEKVPVVVLTNEKRPLNQFMPVQLLMDGFIDDEHAASGMREWPGYEKTETTTPMQAITFVAKESFDKLPKRLQNKIIKNTFDTLVEDKRLRHLFFPTLCLNAVNLGATVGTWIDYLRGNGILSESEEIKMKDFEVHGRNIYELYDRHPDIFKNLTVSPNSTGFKELVLGIVE